MYLHLTRSHLVELLTEKVVFADGSIHDVSYSTYPDLFYALRGGGNNFGIVTRFDMVTYSQGLMWGGSLTYLYTPTIAAEVNAAFSNLNVNNADDPYAQAILAYTYYQPYDAYLISSQFTYGKPVVNPPILQPFTAVQGNISSTLAIKNLTDEVKELAAANPDGFRYVSLFPPLPPSKCVCVQNKNSANILKDNHIGHSQSRTVLHC